ncbi:hypothetical protein GGQ22_20095 [Nocardioides sp. zg-579]|uniref:Uncharacterized protein n=1 Tax=Nocardioides marmotae TaxID=2663857 RepID=A0A6I3JH66_9ACTN|nr:hypothetical protein [Nocardioides marmotae]MCR6033714.1 hypothetical protein [Gordonia jinghuaiqii]MTB97372.1 hypothetical protein [Nocardioides marmotae]QKE01710.1 hypothetical protein HPC71_11995 [Nocardioides marmotae]
MDRGRAIAMAPTSVLRDVRVRRTPRGLDVTAWWGCLDPQACPLADQAVAASGDDFATATYDEVGRRQALRRLGAADRINGGRPTGVPATRGLVSVEADSLVAGVRAVVAGGDGATLLPFQRVVRGTGGRWDVFDVPEVDGERGYVSGAVVLPDGRLLVLLPAWSGDRAGRPSTVHHGLWVSAGADWSSYRPWAGDPGGVQDLRADPRAGGVLWLLVADDVAPLLVSTDGGRTLRAVRTR